MTIKHADQLLTEAATTDARRDVPVALIHTPLVPPDGWEDLRPWIELRRARGIAQGQIAGAANTTSTIICELERGRRRITPRWVERYRDAVERCVAALDEQRREAARARVDRTLPWVDGGEG
jgi:predicted transcriptional regulator